MSKTQFPSDLIESLREAKHIMVFTGAGISAESGIPTFRDPLSGLWENFDAEDLASPLAFRKNKALVWGWYEWRRMKIMRAEPNLAHIAVARLERLVPQLTLVTQNVDDLHERAGSTNTIHLHGQILKPRCFGCNRPHQLPSEIPVEPESGRLLVPPKCHHCGGYIRPGVIWFGENLPERELKAALAAAKSCDLMIVIGTSGVVMPAAQIPVLAKSAGKRIVEINPNKMDGGLADWTLALPVADALPKLINLYQWNGSRSG